MVMGANSIVAYSLNWLSHDFLRKALERHFGQHIFLVFGTAYEPLVQGACILALMWLMLYWLYRQRIFVRI
jgi:heparan-alpha-glucosaminide N-acetyltransferase